MLIYSVVARSCCQVCVLRVDVYVTDYRGEVVRCGIDYQFVSVGVDIYVVDKYHGQNGLISGLMSKLNVAFPLGVIKVCEPTCLPSMLL